MAAPKLTQRLSQLAVIPVLRLATRTAAEQAIDCLLEADFKTVELTLTTPDAIALLRDLRRRTGDEFLVGAGTVLDLETAQRCLDAGADYLVSPCLVTGMAQLAHAAGRAALIGGFTPGEVLAAWREGAHVVKVFPAASRRSRSSASDPRRVPGNPVVPDGRCLQCQSARVLQGGGTHGWRG